MRQRNLIRSIILLLFISNASCRTEAVEILNLRLRFEQEIFSKNFSGRVYVFFGTHSREPRNGPDWFHPEPFLALDVTDWKPGTDLNFATDDPEVLKFPRTFNVANIRKLKAQAVVRFNPYDRNVGTGIGNGFSEPQQVGNLESLDLQIVQRVSIPPAPQLQQAEIVSIASQLLSDFHSRSVTLQATVTLPAGYAESPEKRYPVIYEIPGFGGTHLDLPQLRRHRQPRTNSLEVDFLKVMLDPSCPLGHHVFANSANNGPYGDALIQELIPEIERKYRTDARPDGRFLTGHSSGGWSSLWLQVTYPRFFGGTWSTSPDPVDFRDFQRINLYAANENMFTDRQGSRRPLARMNGNVMLWYDSFAHMEDVLGDGGQLHSFEAVFSPRSPDGTPRGLWNRQTGELDPSVVEAWKAYDINLLLRNHWSELKPELKGKLHIIMGDQDTFYLEGATILLKQTLTDLGSDGQVTILPGRNHFDLFAGGLPLKIEEEIALQYKQHLQEQ